MGRVDETGLLLALAVLFWIPTHNLTLSMLHFDDYRRGGVPIFPAVYGYDATRRTVAISSVLSVVAMSLAFIGVGLPAPAFYLSIVLGAGLLFFALRARLRPADKANAVLFRVASVYMLCCMVLLAVGSLAAPL